MIAQLRERPMARMFYEVNVLWRVLCGAEAFCAGVKLVIFKEVLSRGAASGGSDF